MVENRVKDVDFYDVTSPIFQTVRFTFREQCAPAAYEVARALLGERERKRLNCAIAVRLSIRLIR